MQDWEKINAVARMQEYIQTHIEEEIPLEDLSCAAGYSLWHSVRIFKELLGKTPFEYIRALRLTAAAKELRDSGIKVIDAAMHGGFDSHDGFTRAFAKQFDITPRKYRLEKPPVSYFTFYPIRDYYLHIRKRSGETMKDNLSGTVTVQEVQRPPRKMILLRSEKATEYFSFCEERGCEWEGLMNSVIEKMDQAALLELPSSLVREGTSHIAAGIEVPADYAKPLPSEYEMVDLPACTMLYFRGMPFEKDEDFGDAMGFAFEALENYQPEEYGYQFAYDEAPRFNFGASAQTGAKLSVPVRKL